MLFLKPLCWTCECYLKQLSYRQDNFLAHAVTFRDFMAGNFMARDFLAGDFLAHHVTFGDFMAGNFVAGDFLGGYSFCSRGLI